MVAPELKLSKKATSGKEVEAHSHTEGCLGCAALASHGRATNPRNQKIENESERLSREP